MAGRVGSVGGRLWSLSGVPDGERTQAEGGEGEAASGAGRHAGSEWPAAHGTGDGT